MTKGRQKLEDLAQMAGVSIATVSRALADNPAVSEETRRRIWKLAIDHQFPLHRYGVTSLMGTQATIAVFIPPLKTRNPNDFDPFIWELVAAITDAAAARNGDTVISHVTPTNYDELNRLVQSSRADGHLFIGQAMLHQEFNRLADSGRRFVVWGASLPGQNYCSVGSDNFVGGRRATRHMLRLGRRKPLFLGETVEPEMQLRHEGFREALAEADLPVLRSRILPCHLDVESAEAAIDSALAEKLDFDCIIAANDRIALGAIRSLQRHGRKVPDDVAVIGYDNAQFGRYSTPALSTISQDPKRGARLMVSKLLSRGSMIHAKSEQMATELIVRESCGG